MSELRRVSFPARFEDWRDRARDLLAEGVPPEQVDWIPENDPATGAGAEAAQPSLLALPAPAGPVGDGERPSSEGTCSKGASSSKGAASNGAFSVPKAFVDQARKAACFRDPERWTLLYRILWRITRGGERRLLAIEVDPNVYRLRQMVKAVRRDLHKMHAFVRFRKVESPAEDSTGETWYIAWHRPDHLILRAAAPFFRERFNDQRWSILTPDGSMSWDLETLTFGPPVPRHEAPSKDELEDLWLAYYASIFNPARVNPKAMKAEMPVKHWDTLPEAALIPELLKNAPKREKEMIEAPRRPPARILIRPQASLDDLAAALPVCQACELCDAGRAIFGEGNPEARLMLVGEQPGDEEERRGRPFVGPAGEMLNRALEAAGIERSDLYLTNAVKHFRHRVEETAGGVRRIHQSPGQIHVRACFPWLDAEMARVRPSGIVALGATSMRALVGPALRLKDVRGTFFDRSGGAWTLPTYHPAAILRQRDEGLRRELEAHLVADLRTARQRLAA